MPDEPLNSKEISRLFKAVERLLKIRPRSVGELRQRLKKKFSPKLVEETLNELTSRGILNDRSFAEWWITQRSLSRPRGPYGLAAELRQKFVDKTTIKEAINKNSRLSNEQDLARAVLSPRLKRLAQMDSLTRRRRAAGFLARRGFSAGVISEIINSLD